MAAGAARGRGQTVAAETANFTCWPRAAIGSPRNAQCADGNSSGYGDGCKQLSAMKLTREELLMKLGAAKQTSPERLALDRGQRTQDQVRHSPIGLIATSCDRRAGARADISCAPTSLRAIPHKLWNYYLQLVRGGRSVQEPQG